MANGQAIPLAGTSRQPVSGQLSSGQGETALVLRRHPLQAFAARPPNGRRAGPRILAGLAIAVLLTGCAARVEPPGPAEGSHSVTIEVSGLECCEGALRVALYNAEEHWLRENQMVRGQVVPVMAETQTVEIAGIPAGEYAVAAFQDRNASGRLERFLGLIPREPYGFSGGGGRLRPPDFESAAFSVPADGPVKVPLRPAPL